MEEKIFVTKSTMPPYEEYIEKIKSLWESHIITNMGKYHKELECKLQELLDINKVSLTANGHSALELAIQSMNFKKGSEVITTPYTFISTTHAIVRNGLEPVFCDIKDDFTIDESKIESLITEKTVAVVAVHVYGNICNVDKINDIAKRNGLKVIYDAAHAFGEKKDGVNIAKFGDVSTFSFHATKVFNTIEGGAVCSADDNVYKNIYNLKNFGIQSEELVAEIGMNAKMNEFQAVMGLCNLEHFDEAIQKRKKVVELYNKLFGDVNGVTVNNIQFGIEPNYAYYPVLFEDEAKRNYIYSTLAKENIFARKYFYPITADQKCFGNKYLDCNLEKARDFSKRVLVLPLYPDLDLEVVSKIVDLISNNL